jgi:general stress protein 26
MEPETRIRICNSALSVRARERQTKGRPRGFPRKPNRPRLELGRQDRACMLLTMSGRGLRARPMHALPDREGGCLWFITDQRGAKDDEIKAAPDVCLAFADTRSKGYLSITGRAEVLHDVAKATA